MPGTARSHADDEADSAKRLPSVPAEARRIGHSYAGMRTNFSVADLRWRTASPSAGLSQTSVHFGTPLLLTPPLITPLELGIEAWATTPAVTARRASRPARIRGRGLPRAAAWRNLAARGPSRPPGWSVHQRPAQTDGAEGSPGERLAGNVCCAADHRGH